MEVAHSRATRLEKGTLEAIAPGTVKNYAEAAGAGSGSLLTSARLVCCRSTIRSHRRLRRMTC
jgi:hypothetical protein